jgi:putative transposase
VAYRTVKICWQPQSKTQWAIYSAARKEAARLWNDLVERHYRLRRANWKWASKGRFQKWAKGRYANLHSQSVQQIVGEFLEAVNSTRQLRKKGCETTQYPNRKSWFREVVYTNQGARIRDDYLMLPNGSAGTLKIKIPATLTMPGRLMEARLGLFKVILVFEVPDEQKPQGATIGIDLGVNSLMAATDGSKASVISGRAIKSAVRYRNQRLGGFSSKQSAMTKGSLRWKRIQRRKSKMLAKNKRRINDMLHKATRQVAKGFPNAKAYVGKPFNSAAQKLGRITAQQVSLACNRKIIDLLNYKLTGVKEVNEAYSSQTCSVCGQRSKQRRRYRCKHCGLIAQRDVVGAVNILSIGQHNALLRERQMPQIIKYKYPAKLLAGSRADTPQVAQLN